MSIVPRPVVLLILDGWGYREDGDDNAILAARKPVWDSLWASCPHTLIQASATAVGLPSAQMGNSEVGHLNLGAGRIVYQEYTRINRSIEDGSFHENPALTQAVDAASRQGKAVHIIGLLSDGGVHSHIEHILAMLEMAVRRGAQHVYVHAFLDGRDTPPKSAKRYIDMLEYKLGVLGAGQTASLIGRFYALDRDRRWDRVQAAYDLLTQGKGQVAASPEAALEAAYAREESDEFVQPTSIRPNGGAAACVEGGDTVIFMNYRADRARELTEAFINREFKGFERKVWPQLAAFVSLTEYNEAYDIPVAFPSTRLHNGFGEYVSKLGLRQLRIAETEKYAHVTFFFNGGEEQPFPGEDRVLIPSPKVATYDEKPEMSAPELTDELVARIHSGQYDFIICNYANPDMVGHTGNFPAAVKAIETLDQCLGRVVEAARAVGGEVLITADHGNAEQMADPATGQAHTAHTCNLVPFVYIGRPGKVAAGGALEDVSPTMLYLRGLAIPPEMSGRSLVQLNDG
ncbi:2,3-bisphosphoglycerate-independent phosphoglycerate mutase [Thermithiobacillus plumbiphilus]|uniref:2,3-bisphosphoglycerate-independent phosphoglycerate mutase n=1 Tax=Thermithiobacillus plumbiphilus TaxID=1729899 RepID=A0ABU9D9R2_9PROT